MPPRIIDLPAANDPEGVARQAAEALSEGKLVVFPTETVYGLAARAKDENAVRRLLDLKGRVEGSPLTLALRGADEALDYCPTISPLATRLARRCWPGPLTLVLDANHPLSLVAQLPDSVRECVAPKGEVGLRVPQHDVVLDAIGQVDGPVVLTSANRSGRPDARTATEAIDSLGPGIDLVLDDGVVPLGSPSTVASVHENHLELLREGVIQEDNLRRLSARILLFVCTGNTCRSPLAEVICEQLLAERFGCTLEELEERGNVVLSAGLAAVPGMAASQNSSNVAKDRGLSLADHQTQPVTETVIRFADRIYTMTQMHRRMILSQWPEAVDRVFTLASDGSDIADPIGGPLEEYQRCSEQIEAELRKRVDEWD